MLATPAIFMCPYQDKTWISNVILCHGIFLMFNELGRELIVHFVDIGGILTITV
jgi:hypothetical protein